MKRLLLASLILLSSCAHFSNTDQSDSSKINAPVDTVWIKTLQILPTEKIIIVTAERDTYTIEAEKELTTLSKGDKIFIRLVPRSHNTTTFSITGAGNPVEKDSEHQTMLRKDLFKKVKEACEGEQKTRVR